MSYHGTLKTAVKSLEKAQSELDPDKLNIPQGSSREAAVKSSLELAADILELRMGD